MEQRDNPSTSRRDSHRKIRLARRIFTIRQNSQGTRRMGTPVWYDSSVDSCAGVLNGRSSR